VRHWEFVRADASEYHVELPLGKVDVDAACAVLATTLGEAMSRQRAVEVKCSTLPLLPGMGHHRHHQDGDCTPDDCHLVQPSLFHTQSMEILNFSQRLKKKLHRDHDEGAHCLLVPYMHLGECIWEARGKK